MTNTTQVSFYWSAPQEDGGEAVKDYTVEMKVTQSARNDDEFTVVAQNLTSTSYTYTNVTTSGAEYQFRVKAENQMGFS